MKREDLIEKINYMEFSKREDVKKEFLLMVNRNSEIKTTKLYCSVMAKTINKAEITYSRDWMDFTTDMVDAAFVEIQAKSIITLQSYLTIIKHYLSITTPMELTSKNGFMYTMGLTKVKLEKYINKAGESYRYITPDEFDDIIFNRAGDNLGKSLFILLYLGVKGSRFEDVYKIKDKDINLETGEVICDDKKLCTIPSKYLDIFAQAMKAEHYYKYDSEGKVIFESCICRDSKYFLKRRINKNRDATLPPDSGVVSSTLTDLGKSIRNQYLTGISVYISGETYRLLEYCNMEIPSHTQLMEYRGIIGSTLSYVTMKVASEIILNKLGVTLH